MNLIIKKFKFNFQKIFFFVLLFSILINLNLKKNIFAQSETEKEIINSNEIIRYQSEEDYENFKKEVFDVSDKKRDKLIQDFLINWILKETNLYEVQKTIQRTVKMILKTYDQDKNNLAKNFFNNEKNNQ
jgi:hypothetical protein